MKKSILVLIASGGLFAVACSQSSSKSSAAAAKPADAVEQKLQDLAGGDATNCGRLQSQEAADVQKASDCAMQAAQAKHAFYVAYDLPGLTTALAGNSQGALFTVTAQQGGQIESSPCPSTIRLAQSGRVTCYAPGSMGGMSGGMNPHGDMTTTPTDDKSKGVTPNPSHGKPTSPR
ncbi:MAG TPA: hypothetical protein VF135_01460 [Terriglobales bacterium]